MRFSADGRKSLQKPQKRWLSALPYKPQETAVDSRHQKFSGHRPSNDAHWFLVHMTSAFTPRSASWHWQKEEEGACVAPESCFTPVWCDSETCSACLKGKRVGWFNAERFWYKKIIQRGRRENRHQLSTATTGKLYKSSRIQLRTPRNKTESKTMESISMMGSPLNTKETFLPNGMKNGLKEGAKATVGIIGSGDFSKCLTIRLLRCGYHVVVGSRNPKRAAEFFPHVVDVTHHEDAVAKAGLIFLAIHREHYASLWDLKHLLVGKILVDVSNNARMNQYPESNAEYLASLFPESIVVKGFNVISAWAMQSGPKDASRQVYVCSNSVEARQQVLEVARQLNFIPVDMGTLSSAKEIENIPLHLFTPWKGPVLVAVSLSILFFVYSFIRDIIHPYVKNQQSDFYKIPVEIVNKTLPVVAITLLSLVYLAGLLAAAHQLYYGTKYRRFPHWLDGWMQCRKQLGLLSFFFASVHVVYSLCLPLRKSERYLFLNMALQQVHANVEHAWNEEEVWRVEMYISFGIMSLGLLSLLAITSIPSVNSALNWREFSFIQSTLGYVALLIATFHVLLYGWKRAFEEEYYKFYMPPNFVVALVLPVMVIMGKVLLLLPCVGRKLKRIRRGWENSQYKEETMGSATHVSPERVTIM
ncbi:metalloreductase STEAP2 [Lepisosteus oculatus]